MFNRLIIGMTCLLAIGACRPSVPVSSVSGLAGKTDKSFSTAKEILHSASATDIKYQVLSSFPNPFFCDPDVYPVARGNETELAAQHFAEVQANQEEFQAILKHNGLLGLSHFNAEQILLIYREHKKLRAIQLEPVGNRYQFQLQIMKSKQQGSIVKGFIEDDGTVEVEGQTPNIATCPICLSSQTLIDTPKGSVVVTDLQTGDAVWTTDASGVRIAATVVKTVRVPVAASHRIVHIVLQDKRELWVSPGHQTVDNRHIGSLQSGEFLDGGRIVGIKEEAYGYKATYDLLPSGPTGNYWANGILIGSTLAKTPGK